MVVGQLCVTRSGSVHIRYPPAPWQVNPTTVEQFSNLDKCRLFHRLWEQQLRRQGGPLKLSTTGSESDFQLAEILWTSITNQCEDVLEHLQTKQMTLEVAIESFSGLYDSEEDLKSDLLQLVKKLHDKPSEKFSTILENVSGLWQFVQLCTASEVVVEFLQLFHEKLKFTGKIHPLVLLAATWVSYWNNTPPPI